MTTLVLIVHGVMKWAWILTIRVTLRNLPDVFWHKQNMSSVRSYFVKPKYFFSTRVKPPARQGWKKSILARQNITCHRTYLHQAKIRPVVCCVSCEGGREYFGFSPSGIRMFVPEGYEHTNSKNGGACILCTYSTLYFELFYVCRWYIFLFNDVHD